MTLFELLTWVAKLGAKYGNAEVWFEVDDEGCICLRVGIEEEGEVVEGDD